MGSSTYRLSSSARSLERHDAVRCHLLRTALERHGAQRCQRDQGAHEPPRRLAEHDVAFPGGLLQARGDVDRIADEIVSSGVDNHLAGVDGDAEPDRLDGAALLVREGADGVLHRDRGAHGAQRIVLGDARQPERGHDPVSEQLHDAATVRLDHRLQRSVVPTHEAPDGLRVQALVQRRRADQVGEDDRDDLAGLEALRPAPERAGWARN